MGKFFYAVGQSTEKAFESYGFFGLIFFGQKVKLKKIKWDFQFYLYVSKKKAPHGKINRIAGCDKRILTARLVCGDR